MWENLLGIGHQITGKKNKRVTENESKWYKVIDMIMMRTKR